MEVGNTLGTGGIHPSGETASKGSAKKGVSIQGHSIRWISSKDHAHARRTKRKNRADQNARNVSAAAKQERREDRVIQGHSAQSERLEKRFDRIAISEHRTDQVLQKQSLLVHDTSMARISPIQDTQGTDTPSHLNLETES